MPEQVIIEQASAGAVTEATATLVAHADHTLAVENHERDKLTISADVADVWVSEGVAAAVLNAGTVVRAGGAPLVIDDWKGEVHVISAGAAKVGVTESSFHAGDGEGEEQPGADSFIPSGPSDNYYLTAVATSPDATVPGGSSGEPFPPQPT